MGVLPFMDNPFLSNLVDALGVGLWKWWPTASSLEVDQRWAETLGYRSEDFRRIATWRDLIHPADRDLLRSSILRLMRRGEERGYIEYRMKHRNGQWIWLQLRAMILERDARGRPYCVFGTQLEVTARKQIEELASVENEKLRALLDASFDGIFLANRLGHLIDCNEAFLLLSGYPRDRALALTIHDFEPESLEVRAGSRIEEIRKLGRLRFATVMHRSDGTNLDVEIGVSFLDQNGGLFVCSCRDISERMDYERRLQELSIRDPLTGVFNRRHILERLSQSLAKASRGGSPVTVVIFDIDHFKAINDNFGHLAGDGALCDFTAILSSLLREYDIVGRFGGEEFLVIFEDVDGAQSAEIVTRMLDALREHVTVRENMEIRFTASAGIACSLEFPLSQPDSEAILSLADTRLYRAKESGRDRLVSRE